VTGVSPVQPGGDAGLSTHPRFLLAQRSVQLRYALTVATNVVTLRGANATLIVLFAMRSSICAGRLCSATIATFLECKLRDSFGR